MESDIQYQDSFSLYSNETASFFDSNNITSSDYGSNEMKSYSLCPDMISGGLFDSYFNSSFFCSPVSESFCSTISWNSSDCKDHVGMFDRSYKIIGTFFQGMTLIVGVLGNILVVMVVVRTKSMKTPTNCYLVSLSFADLVVLIASVPNEIISYYVYGDQWIWGKVMCKLLIFLQFTGINASSLSITAFTVERYIAICHPMRAQKLCTVHRAKRIIAFVWIFAVTYCSPWLVLTSTKPLCYKGMEALETCDFAIPRQLYFFYFFADLVLFYVFPLFLSCVLYGLMARILFNNPFSRSASNSTANCGNHNAKSNRLHSKKLGGQANSNHDSTKVQVVKMLVVIVAVFATLWLPYRALLVYNSMVEQRFMDLWYLLFAKTLIFINSAINPILYNALSHKFRRAFRRMLACEGKRSKEKRHFEAASTALYYSVTSTRNHNSTLVKSISVEL